MAGCILGAAGMLAAVVFAVLFCRQRAQIRRLTEDVDEILHGNTGLELSAYREGEAAILRDEIYKMTVRLREQAERLSNDKKELADALTDISHQIRTPLTALNLMSARFSSAELTEEERRRVCLDMKKMLGRIDWLVTSLLKMSKLDADAISFYMEEVRMAQLAKDALEPFLIQAEVKEIRVSCEGPESTAFCGDRAWTLEALQNILKNCLEYTPCGGNLRISWEENALYAAIAVTDDGPGIAPEDLPHLFERFYRGKNAGQESFGVGLALAQMIAARENGVILAENAAGGGSRFELRFYKSVV